MKLAVGTTFYCGGNDRLFAASLRALERFLGLRYDLFVDVSDEHSGTRVPAWLASRYPQARVRSGKVVQPGNLEQKLVDWVASHEEYEAGLFLHSDLLLCRPGLADAMVNSVANEGCLACYWELPLSRSCACDSAGGDGTRRSWLISPHISTWLFSLNLGGYRRMAKRFAFGPGLFCGSHRCRLDIPGHPLAQWIRKQPEFDQLYDGDAFVFCDTATYLRFVIETMGLPYRRMGAAPYPTCPVLAISPNPDGYIHMERSSGRSSFVLRDAATRALREQMTLGAFADVVGDL